MLVKEKTKTERLRGILVRVGLLEKDGSLTKRTYLLLLLGGNCYAFLFLFSFLLGYFGETVLALSIFFLGLYGVAKIFSLNRELSKKAHRKS